MIQKWPQLTLSRFNHDPVKRRSDSPTARVMSTATSKGWAAKPRAGALVGALLLALLLAPGLAFAFDAAAASEQRQRAILKDVAHRLGTSPDDIMWALLRHVESRGLIPPISYQQGNPGPRRAADNLGSSQTGPFPYGAMRERKIDLDKLLILSEPSLPPTAFQGSASQSPNDPGAQGQVGANMEAFLSHLQSVIEHVSQIQTLAGAEKAKDPEGFSEAPLRRQASYNTSAPTPAPAPSTPGPTPEPYQPGLECTGCSGCGNYTGTSWSISDGPGLYPNNARCEWIFISSNAAVAANITFSNLDLEANYDYVRVYDCATIDCSSATEIRSITGPQHSDIVVHGSTRAMKVRFTTDGSVIRTGFDATFNLPPKPKITLCTKQMCSFGVDPIGQLSRTGGSACGDSRCGFLNLAGLSITSIAPGTFQGMVHLKVLILSYNQIASLSRDDFNGLVALENLALNNNRIASVAPGTFSSLSSVESINLENNRISSPIAPGTFAGLSAVKSLSLSYNLITSIGAESFAGLIGVTMLSLYAESYCSSSGSGGCSKIQSIEDGAFRHMPNLDTLDLSNHNLSIVTNATFGGGLAKLQNLDLSTQNSNQYVCGPYGCSYVTVGPGLRIASGAFAGLGGLESLDLQGCQIPNDDLGPGIFRHNRNLTRLYLHNNRLTSLTEDTFKGLNATLRYLTLSYNQISSIAERTFLGFSRLYSLQLENNELTVLPVNVFANMTMVDSNGNYYGGQHVSVHLYGNPLVCRPSDPRYGYLYLPSGPSGGSSSTSQWLLPLCGEQSQSPICSADKCSFAVSPAGLLSRTGGSACEEPTCGILNLAGLSITSIAPGTFQGMVHVTSLILSNNQLSNVTHDDFKDLTALKTLNLNNNRIASVAPGTFAGMSAVESINLDNNRISSPIAPGTFAGLSAVKSLSLKYNLITSIGAESFAGLIGVTMLSLYAESYCSSSGSGGCSKIQSIEDGAFRHMPNLDTLDLSNHNLSIVTNATFGGGLAKLQNLDLSTQNSNQYVCGGPDPYGGGCSYVTVGPGLRIASGAFAGLGGLESLDLQGCQIPNDDLGPGIFRHNRNLTRLYLHNNRLTSLTEDTFKGLNATLRYLTLSSNQISSIAERTFLGFSRLYSLYLSSNRLTSLTDDTFKGLNATLQSLTLSFNQISSIAERTFLSFSRLYNLQLEYNQLSVLPVNVFANMTMVDSNGNYYGGQHVSVHLYGNPLVCRPSDPRYGYLYLPSGPSGGSSSTSQSSLPLCGTQAPAGNATSVVSNPSTQVCSADKCSFNVSSAGVLSRTGGDACGSCGFLYLSYRFITSIAPGTFQGMVHVTTLDLSSNQLGSITYDDFKDLTALKTLNLNNNRIASVAPGTFAGMAAVESINLDNNRISSPIAPGTFAGLSAVKSLSLSYNLITSIGAESFAGLIGVMMLSLSSSSYCYSSQECGKVQSIEDGAFRHMPNLHTLNLQYHDLSIIRTGTFGGGLAKLKNLDLRASYSSWCNPPFGYFSGLRIASGAFAGLGGLESLDLYGCQIPDNVFGQSLFRHQRHLTRLDLGNNRLTSLTEDTFKGLNATLQFLTLSFNQISSIAERTFLGFSRLYNLQLENNELTVLPVNVFANMTNMTMVDSNGNYNGGQHVSVQLYGNPLVCRPSDPRNGYLYVSYMYSSSSSSNHYRIPRCPSKADFKRPMYQLGSGESLPWMEASVISRFSSTACQETRTMASILSTWAQDGGSQGGFSGQSKGWVWFCWVHHPCLSEPSVGAVQGDRMCYAYSTDHKTFHAYGLDTELSLDSCGA